jgi:D-amino-acid dehydrogenase
MTRYQSDVVIVGGGVIGVCVGYYLSKLGREVTILEQAEISSGSSFGNAGLIVPGHSIPLAHPGVLGQGLKWMLRADSPFYVKPRLDWDLITWLWKFRRASNESRMQRGLGSLSVLGYASLELLEKLVEEEDLDCEFHRHGWLMVFRTEEGLEEAIVETRLLGEYGVETEVLTRDEMLKKEPVLRTDLAGGVFFPNEAHLNPAQFVQALARRVKEMGVKVITGTRVTEIERGYGKAVAVRTTQRDFPAEQFVLAAGAWSPDLVRELRIKLPVQAAKGYSLTLPRRGNIPQLPLYLSEAKVAVTPLEEGLRLAGTLELAGMDFRINQRRVDGIIGSAGDYLDLPDEISRVEPWRGFRPCTPDGLPVISRTEDFENVFVATGHCMLGMTLGPVTGKLMAQLMCGNKTDIGLDAFRLKRW